MEKVQTNFVNNSRKIEYNETGHGDVNPTPSDIDYTNILNILEIPLVPAKDQPLECNLPKIPNIYKNISICVSPENVPIKLFNELGNDNSFDPTTPHDNHRNTGNILLPIVSKSEKWPEKSPYACWNCDSYFTGTPIGIPEKEMRGKFHCSGNFCSFDCAARYLSDHENTVDFWAKYSMLCLIYQQAYGLSPESKVPIAPPKETLHKYGGTLSYEKYHNISQQEYTVSIYKLPLIPVLIHIGEMYRSSSIPTIIQNNNIRHQSQSDLPTKNKKYIPVDPIKTLIAETNIKQKNDTLLKSSYTLDKCLKLCEKSSVKPYHTCKQSI